MAGINFDNSYARLPEPFYTKMPATPVAAPVLLALNEDLAASLGIDVDFLKSVAGLQALAGNQTPQGSEPLAQAYAGHQFGGWSPQLGDGRALLLGEVVTPKGARFDIQLKGSGPTPYSRRGDGRAWLGPVLREYVVSEAMHRLGVPTTRALAAVSTGEMVYRESALPGAILTRVASSHIRVGTFQYFASRQDTKNLKHLTDYVIARHYPEASSPLDLLQGAIARQASLIAKWMSLGFIHGVMNTDNAHVAGETIDYGPCAFMDGFDPNKVFSSIDQTGRYAYMRQPDMAIWNMAQLATSLLPLMGEREAAIEAATEVVHQFPDLFQAAYRAEFAAKLGLKAVKDSDDELIQGFLGLMASDSADFTNSFRGLSDPKAHLALHDRDGVRIWKETLAARWAEEGLSEVEAKARMSAVNPAIIPRNHRVEEMIQAAVTG